MDTPRYADPDRPAGEECQKIAQTDSRAPAYFAQAATSRNRGLSWL